MIIGDGNCKGGGRGKWDLTGEGECRGPIVGQVLRISVLVSLCRTSVENICPSILV